MTVSQAGGPYSIPGRVRDLNFCPGTGCVSCRVFGGGPDIVLAIHSGISVLVHLTSVLVHSLLSVPGSVSSTLARVNNRDIRREKLNLFLLSDKSVEEMLPLNFMHGTH